VRGELQARRLAATRWNGTNSLFGVRGPRTHGGSHTTTHVQELGTFHFSSKSCHCVATVFVMRVTEARERAQPQLPACLLKRAHTRT
jgi:hypothetical protein